MSRIGYIYKIHNVSDPNKFYVGSTTYRLIERLQQHKRNCRSKPNNNSAWFQYLRQHNYDGFRISLLATVMHNTRQDLRITEDSYIKQLQPELNSFAAYRSPNEKKEYNKQWGDTNKDHIKQLKKQRYEANNKSIQ